MSPSLHQSVFLLLAESRLKYLVCPTTYPLKERDQIDSTYF